MKDGKQVGERKAKLRMLNVLAVREASWLVHTTHQRLKNGGHRVFPTMGAGSGAGSRNIGLKCVLEPQTPLSGHVARQLPPPPAEDG